ncbi:reverse transcriptase N-terminal domain-containing protein [Streptomyces sp. MUM 136J]|uniref:reverse transcriptase N-terminal domain-containing protein n=1 Tax=Streptomyces sp. MUM 136J TaxID=2791992 RepID=UPI0027E5721F|nr:reverse transcriptase N-terminal domain-containing protein [Streptomyces sp. MUM 136J]
MRTALEPTDKLDVPAPARMNGPEDSAEIWFAVNWDQVEGEVQRLRQRIFAAARDSDLKRLRNLQRLMLRSRANALLSVRRVAQDNQGRATAGIDGRTALLASQKAELADWVQQNRMHWRPRPVKRVYIPKANGKRRPLGIPVIRDRALQALVLNALEPEWEARFEPRSYGFRPGRGCHDAIEAIFGVCKGKNPKRAWILDADLAAAFDRIDHGRLLDHLGEFPARELIEQWLRAGVMEDGRVAPTEGGTPQGGVLTPPTQWITQARVTLCIGGVLLLIILGGPFADGDSVPDGDRLGADEDVLDQEPQDALPLGDIGRRGTGVELGEEAFEAVGEFEVGVTVGELGFESVELAAEVALAGSQVGHPRP